MDVERNFRDDCPGGPAVNGKRARGITIHDRSGAVEVDALHNPPLPFHKLLISWNLRLTRDPFRFTIPTSRQVVSCVPSDKGKPLRGVRKAGSLFLRGPCAGKSLFQLPNLEFVCLPTVV